MPHITLEFSSNLSADLASRELMTKIHRAIASHGVEIGNCKSRAQERPAFLVGDGSADESFVHLDVRMLEGRSAETKDAMGRDLLEILIAAYDSAVPQPQITVEIQDIIRANYFKHPPGTI